MDPITAVMGIASAVPSILKLFGQSDDHVATAQKVIDIAKTVTGAADPQQALQAIQANPQLQMQMQQEVNRHIEQMETLKAQQQKEQNDADDQAMRDMTERIAQLEGTAADLKAVPILGNVMLMARGAQRPLVGYGTMYLDYMVFSGAWKLADGVQNNAFFLINLLVLAFLFGERAIKNLAPLITDMLAAKAVK